MRHPLWQLTGLLSLGLSGCLHGQDWRAVVSKPTIHSVAERRESTPVPKVVARVKSGKKAFVPAVPIAPLPMAQPENETRSVPSDITFVERPDLLPSAPNSTKTLILPAVVEQRPSASFAEFERTITVPRTIKSVSQSKPRAANEIQTEAALPFEVEEVSRSVSEADVAEVVVADMIVPQYADTLPLIIPAGTLLPSKPKTVGSAFPRTPEPATDAADQVPRALFSKPAVPPKELPAVTDALAKPAMASPSAEAERPVRPQDVSVLVQQVFEDLRQRRLNDARSRTDWLKQLVMKRAPANSSRVGTEETPAATIERDSVEPRPLIVDPQATSIDRSNSEPALIHNETTPNQ